MPDFPDISTVATIVLMASTTYLSRILGYVLLRNRTLSPRMASVMENVPGCVLISVIAPAFVSTRPADLLALGLCHQAPLERQQVPLPLLPVPLPPLAPLQSGAIGVSVLSRLGRPRWGRYAPISCGPSDE